MLTLLLNILHSLNSVIFILILTNYKKMPNLFLLLTSKRVHFFHCYNIRNVNHTYAYLNNEILVHQISVKFFSKVKTAFAQIKYGTTKTDKYVLWYYWICIINMHIVSIYNNKHVSVLNLYHFFHPYFSIMLTIINTNMQIFGHIY